MSNLTEKVKYYIVSKRQFGSYKFIKGNNGTMFCSDDKEHVLRKLKYLREAHPHVKYKIVIIIDEGELTFKNIGVLNGTTQNKSNGFDDRNEILAEATESKISANRYQSIIKNKNAGRTGRG